MFYSTILPFKVAGRSLYYVIIFFMQIIIYLVFTPIYNTLTLQEVPIT